MLFWASYCVWQHSKGNFCNYIWVYWLPYQFISAGSLLFPYPRRENRNIQFNPFAFYFIVEMISQESSATFLRSRTSPIWSKMLKDHFVDIKSRFGNCSSFKLNGSRNIWKNPGHTCLQFESPSERFVTVVLLECSTEQAFMQAVPKWWSQKECSRRIEILTHSNIGKVVQLGFVM